MELVEYKVRSILVRTIYVLRLSAYVAKRVKSLQETQVGPPDSTKTSADIYSLSIYPTYHFSICRL